MSIIGPGAWEFNPLGYPPPVMNYSWILPLERNWDTLPTTSLFRDHVWTTVVPIAIGYLLVIHLGGPLMRAKGPDLELRPFLIVWNIALAIFSLVGFSRMMPELLHVLHHFGFQYSVCNPSFATQAVTGFWSEIFCWSKIIELGDTVLLVLRKRLVMFLHWYHHITVLVYSWHAGIQHTAAGRWFITINYAIHAVMYSYYALRSVGVKDIPKAIPVVITSCQLGQMIIGCYIALRVYQAKSRGEPCQQTYENLFLCLAMYASFAVLFAYYFFHAYLSRDTKAKSTKVVDSMAMAENRKNTTFKTE